MGLFARDSHFPEKLDFLEKLIVAPPDACVLWPYYVGTHGYGLLTGRVSAHAYVCQRMHGIRPTKSHQAAHSCGVSNCVNPQHLNWKLPKDNCADKEAHGTVLRGEKAPNTALTNEIVADMRSLWPAKSMREIAEVYGVYPGVVHYAIHFWGRADFAGRKRRVAQPAKIKRVSPILGVRSPTSRLTESQVVEIRARRKAGEPLSSMARDFSVSIKTVWRAARGLSYTNVEDIDQAAA